MDLNKTGLYLFDSSNQPNGTSTYDKSASYTFIDKDNGEVKYENEFYRLNCTVYEDWINMSGQITRFDEICIINDFTQYNYLNWTDIGGILGIDQSGLIYNNN